MYNKNVQASANLQNGRGEVGNVPISYGWTRWTEFNRGLLVYLKLSVVTKQFYLVLESVRTPGRLGRPSISIEWIDKLYVHICTFINIFAHEYTVKYNNFIHDYLLIMSGMYLCYLSKLQTITWPSDTYL